MKEDEIRPQEIRKRIDELTQEDAGWLLARSEGFVSVACPACKSSNGTRVFVKRGFNFESCEVCGTYYVNPRPTSALLGEFYAKSKVYDYVNSTVYPTTERARREKIFVPRVDRTLDICRENNVRTVRLLEIGAGYGFFGEEMLARNVFEEVLVVEPSPGLAATCRSKGLNVINEPFEKVDGSLPAIDVIVCFELIEHLFSPKTFLQWVARALVSGGVLILTCPNIRGFDLSLLKEISEQVDFEHLNYFHPSSISALIEGCGMEVLDVQTPGQLDAELVRKKVIDKSLDLRDQPFLSSILIDEWDTAGDAFQAFLREARMSSHMWVVARKRKKSIGRDQAAYEEPVAGGIDDTDGAV